MTVSLDPLYLGCVVVFAGAALVSFASVSQTRRIDDPDTRRGFAALLLLSGGWASAHVGFLVAPTTDLSIAFYMAGLVVGLAAVGPWLYVCSAYTGRSLHRNPTYRRIAVAVFLLIVSVKLTNSSHQLYFTATVVSSPFPHLAIDHGTLHWLTMGLAYSLSMIGYFMLFEWLTQVSYDTRPLLALVGVTGLPLVFDLVGFATPYLIDITYEPIGVAVFAVGVLFVYRTRFQAVRVTGENQDPSILLDEEDRIREFNTSAAALFPELGNSAGHGDPIWSAVPALAEASATDSPLFSIETDDGPRYYRLTENTFGGSRGETGRLLVVSDVTEREQYRRELERQNDRLEQFAHMVSHDLRNPLSVAMARVELVQNDLEDDNLATAATALDRMEDLIDDVLALARNGQPVDETAGVTLSRIANAAWRMIEAPAATLTVEDDCSFEADSDRLQQLFENLFRNSIQHGSPGAEGDGSPTIRVGALPEGGGFFVEDDGPGIPESDRETVLESGYTTDEAGTGFGLAIVTEIVEAHGWSIDVTEGRTGGARFEITGIECGQGWPEA